MFPYRLFFDSPYYLLLLGLLPLLWLWGRRSLVSISTRRAGLALALRGLLFVLLVMALAEAQLVRTSDRLTVFYLVDRSLSVGADKTAAAIAYINRSTNEQRDRQNADRAGVIVFGRNAAIESPPVDSDMRLPARFESTIDGEATDLAAALRLAQAAFPPDAAKRVVIVTDGNQNVGDALAEASSLAAAGIGIDVVPLERGNRPEVAVEKVVLPADVRQGAPFEARVVLNTTIPQSDGAPISGRLRVSRVVGDSSQLLVDESATLAAGKQVFTFNEKIDSPDFYTYTARFSADDPAADLQAENNEASAFTHVRGQGRVLLIEDWAKPGQFDAFVARLGRANLEVVVQPSDRLFANLAELQRFDVVILADVARTSGDATQKVTEFSDDQIDMLVRNTQQLGAGLVMLGGPDSFGAGAWTNTALERAMPVDFQIKNAKVVPIGALALVLDSSGSMTGDKLAMSKAAAVAAVNVLGREDQVGVVSFDSAAHWIVPMQRVAAGEGVAKRIRQLSAGGGTNMQPGMIQGYRALLGAEAAAKHMILLTDGETEGSDFARLAADARKGRITTSCVAIGKSAAIPLLNQIARAGGGKFYAVDNPRMIPRIFMKEAMRVARPLVYENAEGVVPQVMFDHEILQGIEKQLPPITGYVMTTPKDNPLVEIPLQSPNPAGQTNSILACWQYGLGRSVALTTDVGQRWAKSWADWSGYDKLASQLVRWAMRPTDDDAALGVFAEARDRTIHVTVTALDKEARFANFLNLSGAAIGPDGEPIDLQLAQTAPGRYVGAFPAERSGTYLMSISPGPGRAAVRAGVNVPYSAEFKTGGTNMALVRSLADLAPQGGKSGAIIAEPSDAPRMDEALRTNVFRRGLLPASSRQHVWHVLVFAVGCLFLVDVFNRRVLIRFGWVKAAAGRLQERFAARKSTESPIDSIERLRSRKSQVNEQLDSLRHAARFQAETTPAEDGALQTTLIEASNEPDKESPAAENLSPRADEEDYTSRLLKAKQRVWQDRRSPDRGTP
jgi:Mg-chelatase subunit ChlD